MGNNISRDKDSQENQNKMTTPKKSTFGISQGETIDDYLARKGYDSTRGPKTPDKSSTNNKERMQECMKAPVKLIRSLSEDPLHYELYFHHDYDGNPIVE